MKDEFEQPKKEGDEVKKPLQEGLDFYFTPEGYMVFTAEHHLKRGYCCGNGCRHCPYPKAQ